MRAAAIVILCALMECSLAVAAPTTKPAMNEAAMEKLGWRLASQAYTFRSVSLYETIDTLNALGIKYIEMYPGQKFSPDKADVKTDHNLPQELIDELLKKLKDSNVTAV